MASIQDWASKAARRICVEFKHRSPHYLGDQEAHVAAIIATYAEPLLKLLGEARRQHDRGYNSEACDYPPCPRSYEDPDDDAKCTCSADEWNKRVEEVLDGGR